VIKNPDSHFDALIAMVHDKSGIIGRESEIASMRLAFAAGQNLLIEGPVGVGKTVLALAVANAMGRPVIRIDGDSRFTEQKLTGWFDPAQVMSRGYSNETFFAGPLLKAMREGSILFINELNRMPEAVQNVLLPAMDEGLIQIPHLEPVRAKPGFMIIATQNPREFVATSHISEALLDRMEWMQLGYQSHDEESRICERAAEGIPPYIRNLSVDIVRGTRNHPRIKRGASIRAAIAALKMLSVRVAETHREPSEEDLLAALKMSLPSRIELTGNENASAFESRLDEILNELLDAVKKKS
jgi:gas vesicle protein GvpN